MNPTARPPGIDDVRAFWDAQPLWTGESSAEPGSREFFEQHRRVALQDCFGGALDERIFSGLSKDAKILDLGCGIGFWLVEFWERGFHSLWGADLSERSLSIARKRCEIYGVKADLSVRNAESTGYPRGMFDHVNCQGVIHHTPQPTAAMREIWSILRPGGTASISVYYRNAILRNWKVVRPVAKAISRLGGGLKGRGREGMLAMDDVDDIVRFYDGAENPIGSAYDHSEFRTLIGDGFVVEQVFYHFFPARALPIALPQHLHRALDRYVPFMIYANVRKV